MVLDPVVVMVMLLSNWVIRDNGSAWNGSAAVDDKVKDRDLG